MVLPVPTFQLGISNSARFLISRVRQNPSSKRVETRFQHLPNLLEPSATILTMNDALKTEVLELLEHLPEHADLEDVIRALQVRQNIARGIADLDAGRTRTSAQLVERYRSKLPS
jgi:hypothetical protein